VNAAVRYRRRSSRPSSPPTILPDGVLPEGFEEITAGDAAGHVSRLCLRLHTGLMNNATLLWDS